MLVMKDRGGTGTEVKAGQVEHVVFAEVVATHARGGCGPSALIGRRLRLAQSQSL
jgi:hypothetical protein